MEVRPKSGQPRPHSLNTGRPMCRGRLRQIRGLSSQFVPGDPPSGDLFGEHFSSACSRCAPRSCLRALHEASQPAPPASQAKRQEYIVMAQLHRGLVAERPACALIVAACLACMRRFAAHAPPGVPALPQLPPWRDQGPEEGEGRPALPPPRSLRGSHARSLRSSRLLGAGRPPRVFSRPLVEPRFRRTRDPGSHESRYHRHPVPPRGRISRSGAGRLGSAPEPSVRPRGGKSCRCQLRPGPSFPRPTFGRCPPSRGLGLASSTPTPEGPRKSWSPRRAHSVSVSP